MSMKGIREDDLVFTNGENFGHFSVIQKKFNSTGSTEMCYLSKSFSHLYQSRQNKNVTSKHLKILR